MSNTIPSMFIPFWYSRANGESTTLEMISKQREGLKSENREPSFPKTLTPAKATAGGVGILGLIVTAIGFLKDNSWGKILGIGAAIIAGASWFVDKFFVKSSSTTADSPDVETENRAPEPDNNGNNIIDENTPLGQINKYFRDGQSCKIGNTPFVEGMLEKHDRSSIIQATCDFVADRQNDIQSRSFALTFLEVLPDQQALPFLLQCINDKTDDKSIRAHAAKAIGAISYLNDDFTSAQPLIACLLNENEDSEVRSDIASALALALKKDQQAQDTLLPLLNNKQTSTELRKHIMFLTMNTLPTDVLIKMTTDKDEESRYIRTWAIRILKNKNSKEGVEALLDVFMDKENDEHIRSEASYSNNLVGSNKDFDYSAWIANNRRAVTDMLVDKNLDDSLRIASAFALGNLSTDNDVEKVLLDQLSDAEDNHWVRAAIAEVLGGFSNSVSKPLLSCLENDKENSDVRTGALKALAKLNNSTTSTTLLNYMDSTKDELLYTTAALTLGELKVPEAKDKLAELVFSTQEKPELRRAALEGLRKFDSPIVDEFVPKLTDILENENLLQPYCVTQSFYKMVIETIGECKVMNATEVLTKISQTNDISAELKSASLCALSEIGSQTKDEAIPRHLTGFLDNIRYEVVDSAIRGLAKLGSNIAIKPLTEKCLMHRSSHTALEAAKALKVLCGDEIRPLFLERAEQERNHGYPDKKLIEYLLVA